MADIADQAQQQAAPLNTIDHKRKEGPPPVGQCYNCGETLRGDLRWCDADCREDWELRNERENLR